MTVVLFALVGVTRGEGGVPVACGEGQFGCVASGACISVALMCDGHPDCSDASDENSTKAACRHGQSNQRDKVVLEQSSTTIGDLSKLCLRGRLISSQS